MINQIIVIVNHVKEVDDSEKKRIQEKQREEFKERFRERIAKVEVMDFT